MLLSPSMIVPQLMSMSFESLLGLFDPDQVGPVLEDRFGIPRRRLTGLMSPWAVKRLDEFNGDLSRWHRSLIAVLGIKSSR